MIFFVSVFARYRSIDRPNGANHDDGNKSVRYYFIVLLFFFPCHLTDEPVIISGSVECVCWGGGGRPGLWPRLVRNKRWHNLKSGKFVPNITKICNLFY